MQQILDALEQAGFRDPDGQLLTNSADWHALRRRAREMHAYAVEADKVVKIFERQSEEQAR